jgi:hypothetical protein
MRGGRFLMGLAGAAVLAAGPLLAGCGTQSAQAGLLAASATKTEGQRARLAITTTMRSPGMTVSFTQTGVFDFAHSRGMLGMQSPMPMTVLFLPPKTYFKLPGGSGAPLPHGKSWIALPDGQMSSPLDAMIGPFGGSADPADLLASLRAISSQVTKLGGSTIRDVPVTGYRVAVDPAKAAARLPGWQRAGFRSFARILGRGTIPVEVWVDAQNLVRRVQISPHPPGGTGSPGGHARLTQTTDFWDFGVPVRVSAPPASQVASGPQVSQSVSAGSPKPPRVSGTLSPTQAAAAEQAAGAFWAAVGRNDPTAAAQTVLPSQRSCAQGLLGHGAPKMKVASFRAISAQPAGNGQAVVRFMVKATGSFQGHTVPILPPHGKLWLLTAENAGHWYVDLSTGGAFMFSGACPPT